MTPGSRPPRRRGLLLLLTVGIVGLVPAGWRLLSPSAVAAAGSPPPCTLCVLDPSAGQALQVTGGALVSVRGGATVVDSASSQAVHITGNATVESSANEVVGAAQLSGGGSATPGFIQVGSPGDADPFVGLATPPAGSSPTSLVVTGNGDQTASPGTYSALGATGHGSLTLKPGLYVITQSFRVTGQASVTGTGVTLYFAGQSGMSVSGGGALTLTPPASGTYAGISVYLDRADTGSVEVSGQGSWTVGGAVYAAAGQLQVTGKAELTVDAQVAVASVQVSGGGELLIEGSPFVGAQVTLSPSTAGPDHIGSSQALTATVTDYLGHPLSNEAVTLEVSGANTVASPGLTGTSGQARLSYTGSHGGSDTAVAVFSSGSLYVSSNAATVTWTTTPASPVATSPVLGNFYAERASATSFVAAPGDTPAFGQSFPDVNFNPPAADETLPKALAGIGPSTRPVTDLTSNVAGALDGSVVAQGDGVQAGVGSLTTFDAVFTSTLTVQKAGKQTLNVIADDGFLLGFGGGATAVSGPMQSAPSSGTTPFDAYPLMAAWDQSGGGSPQTHQVTVDFPQAGSYPYELDYFSCCGQQLSLVLGLPSSQSSTPSYDLYAGYADTVRPPGPAGSFPSPWNGSPNTSFVGSDAPYDTGALSFDNNTSSPITLQNVTVAIGSVTYAPSEFSGQTVPANGSLILAGTNGDFDTSDAESTTAASQPATTTTSATSITLTAISTGFDNPIGIGYYQPTNEVLLSVNYPYGSPNNFDLVAADGTHTRFSGVAGLGHEVYMAAIRSSSCQAGFTPGDVYFGTGQPGVIAKVSNDGNTFTNPWVTLPGEGGLLRGGLFQDINCVADGDLIVTTTAGDVWRVTSAGVATEIATGVGDWLEGPTTVPDDPKYGPWAGQILAASEGCGCVRSVDPSTGAHSTWSLGSGNMTGTGVASAEGGVLVVPANQNFFGVDYGAGTLRGAAAAQFNGIVGDIVVATEFPGRLVDVSWDPTNHVFVSRDLLTSNATQFEGTAFTPAGIGQVPPSCTKSSTVPEVSVTIDGSTTTYSDKGQALLAGGADGEACGANESQPWELIGGSGPPLTVPLPPAVSLTLSPSSSPGNVVGATQGLSVTAVDGSGQPISGMQLEIDVYGANTQELSATTDSSGTASASYQGANGGTDVITAIGFMSGAEEVSNSLSVPWSIPMPAPAPSSSGEAPGIFNVSPADQTSVASTVSISADIEPVVGDSLTTWGVTSQLLPSGTVTTLASGTGAAPSPLASFDPSGLAAGTYAITISAATKSGGSASVVTRLLVDGSPTAPGGSSTGGGTAGQTPPSISAPSSPADGSVVTTPTPIEADITAPSGQTIASWSVTYQANGAGPPVTLASGTGTPPSPIASFDPTLLANDTYTITVSAVASGGGSQSTSTTVAVYGNLKLVRYVTTYRDMNVPVSGLQMQVLRTYDSFDQRVSDFGYGWSLSIANFRVSSNRELGAGGWDEYTTGCFILCSWAYKTSVPHFVTVTWPDGHQDVFQFTPAGPQLTLFDYTSGTAAFTEVEGQDAGAKLTVTDSNDQSFTNGLDGNLYDASGNVYNPTRFTLTTRSGQVYVLDENRGLVSETDPSGNSLTVSSSGIQSSNGQSISFTRDSLGRITKITGPGGQTDSYSYDPAGNLATSTDANGNTTTYSYDSAHRLLSATGPGASQPLESEQYDSSGRLVAITNGDGQTVQISSDPSAKTQTYTDPADRLTLVDSYDSLGDLVEEQEIGDGTTRISTWTYNSDGQVLSATDPLGNVQTFGYDADGNLVTETDASGRTTHFTYDSQGNLTSEIAPDGTVEETLTYNGSGDPLSLTLASGSTWTYTYDSAGRLLTSTDPLGNTTRWTYNSLGEPVSLTDPNGQTTTVTWTSADQIASITDPDGSTTRFGYDGSGDQTSVTDGNGNTTTTTYNYLGKVTSVTDPTGQSDTYSYDSAGNLVSATDRSGRTLTFAYDADSRLTSETGPGVNLTYAYDAFGELTQAVDQSEELDFTYDADGDPLTQVTKGTASSAQPATTLSYTYDPTGNVTAVAGPDGTVAYGYNALDQLTSVTDQAGGTFQLGYNEVGELSSLTRPNGVDDTLTYDAAGDLLSRVSSLNGTTVDESAYTYDPAGLRTSQTNLSGTTSYGYDADGQLISATPSTGPAGTYTYDPVGNMLTSSDPSYGSASFNADDELTSDAGNTYSYDADGDLTSITSKATGARTTLTWNALHQLVSVQQPNGSTTTYEYDALGRRIQVDAAGTVTDTVWDGDNPRLQYSGPSALSASYTPLPSPDSELESTSGGQSSYYLVDGLNSVTAVTNASGQVTGTASYGPFGQETASGTPSPFGFTGQPTDTSTGLDYYQARYYDPSTGRFLSQDPLQNLNPYTYVKDSPTNLIDPSGQDEVEYGALLSTDLAAAEGVSTTSEAITTATTEVEQAIAEATEEAATGASDTPIEFTQEGEQFVRVGASPENLNWSFESPGGVRAGTYAFPKDFFDQFANDPGALKDLGDLPGSPPTVWRLVEPPVGTPIQRGIVPGGEFGGEGGAPEVFFPEGW